MKIKSITLLSSVLIMSVGVFGQTTTTVKPNPVVRTADAKPTTAAKLPTVKEVLDKYVAAIGGRAANEKIKTRAMKGTVEARPRWASREPPKVSPPRPAKAIRK
jgi:hypothetical protein